MRSIKVTYHTGQTIYTDINGTDQEIKDYYLNNWFNIGSEEDEMVKAVEVEFID